MTNRLLICHENNTLTMDRTFAKKASVVGSEEYNLLQAARRDYPTYDVKTRQIKRNTAKECYAGLTYEYMRKYISHKESDETRGTVLAQFDELITISQCHSKGKRYPTIKKWFLDNYPEVKTFGVKQETDNVISFANDEEKAG